MSTHDRGAFGALLAEAKALGATTLNFEVDLTMGDDDDARWDCADFSAGRKPGSRCQGRTGEEALRRLVETLREVDSA